VLSVLLSERGHLQLKFHFDLFLGHLLTLHIDGVLDLFRTAGTPLGLANFDLLLKRFIEKVTHPHKFIQIHLILRLELLILGSLHLLLLGSHFLAFDLILLELLFKVPNNHLDMLSALVLGYFTTDVLQPCVQFLVFIS
jgi:hypothetical protein